MLGICRRAPQREQKLGTKRKGESANYGILVIYLTDGRSRACLSRDIRSPTAAAESGICCTPLLADGLALRGICNFGWPEPLLPDTFGPPTWVCWAENSLCRVNWSDQRSIGLPINGCYKFPILGSLRKSKADR